MTNKIQNLKTKKTKNNIFISFLFVICYLLFAPSVLGAIRYPIKELGGCRNQQECKLFCEIPKNTPACWSYNKYILTPQVLGEATTPKETLLKNKGVKFPIEELGNCASVTECKDYCQKQENHASCLNFGLKKKLFKAAQIKPIAADIIKTAQTELGCQDETSCRNFCGKKVNQEVCKSFGQKYNLKPDSSATASAVTLQMMSVAKKDLGCTDIKDCLALCNKEENKNACSVFAQRQGLTKKAIKIKLCGEEKQCLEYCRKFPNECPGFSQALKEKRATDPASFLGPAGCKTEEECKTYCQAHPNECPSFKEGNIKEKAGFGSMVKPDKVEPEKVTPTKIDTPKPTEDEGKG